MTARQERLHEVTASFHTVAEVRAAGGYAPIYQQMAAGVAADPELLAIAAAARPGQNPPSLLLGATQFLLTDRRDHPLVRFYPALTGQPAPTDNPYPALRDFVLTHRDQITAIVATRLVQTNEPARTSYLYPALLAAQRLGGGQPLALIEIGSSAGLTLVPDRYAYDYGTGALHGDPTSPILLAQAPHDTTVVVFHTAVLAHFTQQARTAFVQRLLELSACRPITWVQGEPRPDEQPRLRLAQLDDGQIQTDDPLGRYHPHGAWLEWVSQA